MRNCNSTVLSLFLSALLVPAGGVWLAVTVSRALVAPTLA